MPRVAADPSAYLDALKAVRRKAKAGTFLNAQGLARTIGVTWRIVEAWILKDQAFPVARRGGQGNPWQFELIPVLDHLINQARSLETARKARRAVTSRLAGFGDANGSSPLSEAPPVPGTAASHAADRAAEARALKALAEAQMIAHRLKQMQREYVRRDTTEALISDLMTTMQTETLAIAATLDSAGHWPPALRESVEDALRNVLIAVQDKLETSLKRWGPGGRN